jgi:hypothetical protein
MNMRRKLFILLFALCGLSQSSAQDYEYVPFVREGVKWVYSIADYHYFEDYYTNPARGDNKAYRTIEMKGDTVINGKTYKVVHKYGGNTINEENDTVPVYVREEDKMVYAIVPDYRIYDDCWVGNYFGTDEYYDAMLSGQEFLLYDFQDPVSYWANFCDGDWYDINLLTDTIVVGNHFALRYHEAEETNADIFQIIEGIGAIGRSSYPLAFFIPMSTGIHAQTFHGVEKVVENGEVIYPQDYVEDRYMPLIREGVKWVNERVVIHDGDTTRYFYTYEFKGNHPIKGDRGLTYKALYSYDGLHHELDTDNDDLVAGLREDESCIAYECNVPLNACIAQERNMIDFNSFMHLGIFLLYKMGKGPDGTLWCKNSYIDHQLEEFLNDENFVQAEPVMIDGYRCSRLAYVGEQGDTLAYVVEGIGFDSRDMGDLLTPFTRKPDPSADYQEYCGLSHVVKDGKVIYKGLRWREETMTGIDEVVAEQPLRPLDDNYYNLMGQPVGKDVPTAPGIYIHHGQKICVSRTP